MNELAKIEARNYLSAAGFFVFAACEFLWLITFVTSTMSSFNSAIDIVGGIAMLIIATLLMILRKRDMIAILFVMLGFLLFFWSNAPGQIPGILTSAFALLIAIVTLMSKDKQKWLVFLLPFLLVVGHLFMFSDQAHGIVYGIVVVLSLYYAFVCASERINLPGRKFLTADENTDFKSSGSVLGYILFALIAGAYTVYYIIGGGLLTLEILTIVEFLGSALLIYTAIMLFAVGKMRFTPVMFLLLALVNFLVLFSSGPMFIGTCILMIIIGIFAMLRKESRILPGIMLIIYGCTDLFTAFAGGNMPVVSVILNGIPCLIAIYLAFAVYSQKKLPLF